MSGVGGVCEGCVRGGGVCEGCGRGVGGVWVRGV